MIIEFKTAQEKLAQEKAKKQEKAQEVTEMQKKVSGSDVVTARLKSKCDCWGPYFHD